MNDFSPVVAFESHMDTKLKELETEMAKATNELKKAINAQKRVPLTKKELAECRAQAEELNCMQLTILINWATQLKETE